MVPRSALFRVLAPTRVPAAIAAVLFAGLALAVAPPSSLAADEPAPPLLPAPAPREPMVAPLYFFSPDWRPPDLGKLTVAIEGALAAGGVTVTFQAFTRYEDFEQQARTKPPVFVIAPAWLESVAPRNLGVPLHVIARPLRHGKTTYRKALMTRANIDSIDDLARGSVAATVYSMGPGSPSTVLEAFHLAADSARVVPVPKDVDALLALSFGQVDAALVTGEQYEQLDRTSPPEAEKLRVLAFSPEVKLPPVFACGDRADPVLTGRLKAVLLRLAEVPEGPGVLAMLGFDAFVAEEPARAEPAGAAAAKDAAGAAVAKPVPPANKSSGAVRRAPATRPAQSRKKSAPARDGSPPAPRP